LGVSKATNGERGLDTYRLRAEAGDVKSDMKGGVERPLGEWGGIPWP